MLKPKPRTFTAEEAQKLVSDVGSQVVASAAPKSLDPKNYPVFEVPINAKVLVYVGKHTVLDDLTGIETLRMDVPYTHTVKSGSSFSTIRCINGLTALEGYDGTCPLCEAASKSWDLANLEIKLACDSKGVDPEDKENAVVKAIRQAAFEAKITTDSKNSQYVTFPITVIETSDPECKIPKVDEEGNILYTHMWYSVSRKAYNEKWAAAVESFGDDAVTSPAGQFFTLNYTYDAKGKPHDKMNSAKALRVIPRRISNAGATEAMLQWDKETEDWTPIKAMETLVANYLHDFADLTEEANRLIETISLAQMQLQVANGGGVNAGAGATFSLSAPAGDNAEANAGIETDIDGTEAI